MRKKKYKSVLLGILLVLVLVGCGNTKETGKPEESEMTVETAAEEEAIEIQWQTQGTQEEVTNIDTEGLKEDFLYYISPPNTAMIINLAQVERIAIDVDEFTWTTRSSGYSVHV